jgi:hypothetical protein
MTNKYLACGTARPGLLGFATMRSFSFAPGFLMAGTLAFACTVYDSELVTTDGLIGAGADSSGGTSTAAGTGNDAAGKTNTNTGGTTTAQAGESGSGGTDVTPSDGGEGNAGGEASSGTGGTAATGGKAGSSAGGTAATGGKAGAGGTGGSAGASGSGGSAGGASVVKCADHPLSLKTTWVATASSSSVGNGTEADGLYNPPAHMLDNSYTERWSSGHAQAGDEWIQIDLGVVSTITDLTLNPGNDAGDYPRMYAVRVSNKSEDFAATVKASGVGMPGTTFVHFNTPAVGRYITVRQTNGTAGNPWWTIAEVLVGCTD